MTTLVKRTKVSQATRQLKSIAMNKNLSNKAKALSEIRIALNDVSKGVYNF